MDADTRSLVIGFILTTVLGGLLGAGLQRTQWNRQARLDIAKQSYVDATTMLEQVLTSIDRRYYDLYRWYSAVRDDEPEQKIAEREAIYFATVHEWNEKLRTHHQGIRRHLGASHALSYLNYRDDLDAQHPSSLHYRFVLCTDLVHGLRAAPQTSPAVWSAMEKLNWHLTEFAQEATTELIRRSHSLRRLRSTDLAEERSEAMVSRPEPQHPSRPGPP
ncbi:hypothetical protein [Cellulomonas cellasea]|uniref:Uncharacterized protein n=1 Tax=Cellulomonas cellasea TaxID=43670 RepID=A0A7W4YBM9_9CELL|nr:hypothetical protein [Cellulomonas cellasea]MBB2923229.1 hypothetical protein [Cellulomonas cellasea]